ncbi:MAG: hypothetical protein Q8K72_21885 [Acidimicrobiales bacterium]|nr:hypothetical protein [Acidimicrobiales bacterium]
MLAALLATLLPSVTAPPAVSATGSAPPAFTPIALTPLPDGFHTIEADAATRRVFVSSPTSSTVTVLGFGGDLQGSLAVPGAGSMLLDGQTLFVVSTLTGRIDAFDTVTLAPAGSYGSGSLLKPTSLVKAGGQLWTSTGGCDDRAQLVSIAPGTGAVTVHPWIFELASCMYLFTTPADPNLVLGFDQGVTPTRLVRFDVSTGAPLMTGTLGIDSPHPVEVEVLPGGQMFAMAMNGEIRTFRIDPLEAFGVIYPTSNYPRAIEATAGAGGLIAGAPAAQDSGANDIEVFRLGEPSQPIYSYDFGPADTKVWDAGLAFSPGGTLLFTVSGDSRAATAVFTVFGPPPAGGRYHPLPPARILDTRDGRGPLGPAAAIDLPVTGQGGVPLTGVSAVAMNVTVTQPSATSFLTLYPSGAARPLASNLNFTAGRTIPNLVVVKIGAGGRVTIYNLAGTVDVIVDVAGWFSDPAGAAGDEGRYTPLVPSRLLDTREGGVPLGPNGSLELQVGGRAGVPASDATAAVLNVVATGTTATSFLTVHPSGQPRPMASNLNFDAGDTVSNRTMVKLGAGGKVTIYNLAGATDVVVDIAGWYGDAPAATTAGTYAAAPPWRVLDTRTFTGGVWGPIAGGTAVAVQVTGRGGVPTSGVSAVVLNATSVDPVGAGFLTLFPTGGNLPLASDVNYAGGETRPNLTVVKVGVGGKIDLYTSTSAHVVLDVAGWFS